MGKPQTQGEHANKLRCPTRSLSAFTVIKISTLKYFTVDQVKYACDSKGFSCKRFFSDSVKLYPHAALKGFLYRETVKYSFDVIKIEYII